MHRTLIIILLVMISTHIFTVSQVFAITPEELARLSEKGAADKRKVDQQLNLDDLHYQLRIDVVEQPTTRSDVYVDKNDSSKIKTVHKQSIKENDFVGGETEVRQKRHSTKYSSNQKQQGFKYNSNRHKQVCDIQ